MTEAARSYGGVPAAERAAARRARLVEATIGLLAEGESATTMTKICARAGLTERYFYESFASRDEAMLAAMDTVSEEIAAAALKAIEETDAGPDERVRAALAAVVSLLASSPDKGRVALVESSATPTLRARRHALLAGFADLAAREAATLYGDLAWPVERARVNGLVLAAGIAELVGAWLTGEVELVESEVVAAASDLFVAVARRDPAP